MGESFTLGLEGYWEAREDGVGASGCNPYAGAVLVVVEETGGNTGKRKVRLLSCVCCRVLPLMVLVLLCRGVWGCSILFFNTTRHPYRLGWSQVNYPTKGAPWVMGLHFFSPMSLERCFLLSCRMI